MGKVRQYSSFLFTNAEINNTVMKIKRNTILLQWNLFTFKFTLNEISQVIWETIMKFI